MMVKRVLVSIIITNYNYSKYISRAITSCLNQSVSELVEILVIDDCSTDNSTAVINNFSSQEISKYFLDENKGVAYCSNFGIIKSKGMFVMRVDADDYIHEKMVEYLLDFLEMNAGYSFSYCDHIRVDDREVKSERIYLNSDDKLFNHGAGILFRKSHLEAVGLYDEDMLNCEDMLLLKRLRHYGYKGIYINLPLYRYFRHEDNMTNDVDSRKEWTKEANKRV